MFRRNPVQSVLRISAVIFVSALGPDAQESRAADHRDGPRVTANASTLGAMDINDLYVFTSPSHPNNTVLVLTTGGAAVGILSPPYFQPGAVYEFRVSNDGDPTTDEFVVQVVFSDPDKFLRQAYMVVGVDGHTGHSAVLASGGDGQGGPAQGGGGDPGRPVRRPVLLRPQRLQQVRDAGQGRAPRCRTGSRRSCRRTSRTTSSATSTSWRSWSEVPDRVAAQSSKRNPKLGVWARTVRRRRADRPDGPAGDQHGDDPARR